jgi:hypothetical protein
MEPREYLYIWFLALVASATVVGGKIGSFMWGLAPDPPSDPSAAEHWARRRRWLAYSEISALPAFATIGVASVAYGSLNPIAAVLIAMGLGGVGFPLLLDGAQFLFRRRLGLPQTGKVESDA